MLNRKESLAFLLSIKSKSGLFSEVNVPKVISQNMICWNGASAQDREAANLLLEHVINANWVEIEKMIAENPSLMFMEAKAKDIDGKQIRTTPLKYALYVYDRYTREIFSQAAEKYGLLDQFVKQAKEQVTHFDLQLFREAYEKFFAQGKLLRCKEITEEAFDKAWREIIGGAQRYMLPRHMLRQMCEEENDDMFYWSTESEFDEDVRPVGPCSAFLYSFNNIDILDSFSTSGQALAVDFAIYNCGGDRVYATRVGGGIWLLNAAVRDRDVIDHLFEMRQQQQVKDLEMLFLANQEPNDRIQIKKK